MACVNQDRVGFDGKGLTCLTPGVGTHEATLNADGSFLIDSWSAMDMPTKVSVRDGVTGKVTKKFGQADRGANRYPCAAGSECYGRSEYQVAKGGEAFGVGVAECKQQGDGAEQQRQLAE